MPVGDWMVLKNGPIVKKTLVALAISLEARGHVMTAANGRLSVTNGSKLTAEDRAAIAANKSELIEIVRYCASGVCDADVA